jgi:DNA mismatch repair ATPase MutS
MNYKMLTKKEINNLIYKYILVEGISDIKGGMIVLQQMNYPKEITESM